MIDLLYNLSEKLVIKAEQSNTLLAVAESCSGGLIASSIVSVPGSSAVFDAGFVTYSYESKANILGIDPQLIQIKGAVSAEVVEAMAFGAIAKSRANLSVAVTGIAGPAGGTKSKPVGLVYIATVYNGNCNIEENIFQGDRQEIREQTTESALKALLKRLEYNNS